MKSLKLIALSSSLLVATVLASVSANAAEVETAGQAISICTEQAQAAHPDYKRSKSTKIRERRGVFKITMRVFTETEKFKTFCEVQSDGTVSYAKA